MKLIPVVYEHAAHFLGRRPWDVSRDRSLLREAHAEAYRAYRQDPLVVGIDVYSVECEAYGGTIGDTGGNEVPASIPWLEGAIRIPGLRRYSVERDGRFPMVLETARKLREDFPEAAVVVPLNGPFSIAVGMLGFQNLLIELMSDPEPVSAALNWLAEGQAMAVEEIAAHGLDVVFFESGSAPPLVSPHLFRQVLHPPLKSALRPGRDGTIPPLIMGGDTVRILPELLSTGTEYLICPMETDRGKFMEEMLGHPEVTVRMNLTPGVFVGEDHERVKEEIKTSVRLAGGRRNTLLGTGVLPYDANPELVRFAQSYAAAQG